MSRAIGPLRAALAACLCAALLAACATGPAGGPAQPLDRLAQAALPGRSTTTQVLAALGPATRVRFDSGMAVWMYRYGGENGGEGGEYVLLFGADGVLKKTRQGPVWSPPAP